VPTCTQGVLRVGRRVRLVMRWWAAGARRDELRRGITSTDGALHPHDFIRRGWAWSVVLTGRAAVACSSDWERSS